MESLITILNFEEYHPVEINSPRTLEACLRCGYEPTELITKQKKYFNSKDLNEEMITMKYEAFERKRKGESCLFLENKLVSSCLFLFYMFFLFFPSTHFFS